MKLLTLYNFCANCLQLHRRNRVFHTKNHYNKPFLTHLTL